MAHSAVRGESQEPLIGISSGAAHHFSETFGIKDFFREGPISRSQWLEKVVECVPNAYSASTTGKISTGLTLIA